MSGTGKLIDCRVRPKLAHFETPLADRIIAGSVDYAWLIVVPVWFVRHVHIRDRCDFHVETEQAEASDARRN